VLGDEIPQRVRASCTQSPSGEVDPRAVLVERVGKLSIPVTGSIAETASARVSCAPTERSAARTSRSVCIAGRPMSALVTTTTSGISMIPAFRNWSTSPAPGCATTATVSATSAISTSDCPTPTLSITTTSNALASACAPARVAGARPPRRSPVAVERMNTRASAGS
jgi:hypothetical protein